MGACCDSLSRKSQINTAYNEQILGLKDYSDLGDVAPNAEFKIEDEAKQYLTKTALLKFYDTLSNKTFSQKLDAEQQVQLHTVGRGAGVLKNVPVTRQVFRFEGKADDLDRIVRAVCQLQCRKKWDSSIEELEQVGQQNGNMVIWRQLNKALIEGFLDRELVLKRFIFRQNDRIYVYFSSVPDTVFPVKPESQNEYRRAVQGFGFWCFERQGDDAVATLFN